MNKLINKAKYVLRGEEGASNVEIIVWISVVLCVATLLFLFKDAIINFLKKAIGEIDKLQVN